MTASHSNCWEFMKCGREPGGAHEADLGICPAAQWSEYDGINHGTGGGRFCWAIAGTFCGGKVQGTFAQKALNCMTCPFYAYVVKEERQTLIVNPSQIKLKVG